MVEKYKEINKSEVSRAECVSHFTTRQHVGMYNFWRRGFQSVTSYSFVALYNMQRLWRMYCKSLFLRIIIAYLI